MKPFVVALVALFLACTSSENTTKNTAVSFTPHLRHEAVPIANNTDRQWQEGWLVTLENYSDVHSDSIALPFIVSVAADSVKRSNIPILIMSGGPGNSSLNMANGLIYTPWGEQHDVIVFEQRGTPHAQPALLCPEIDSLRISGIQQGMYGQQLDSLKAVASQLAYQRLAAQHDLNHYHTLASVEDLEVLRKALDIDQWVLYGMSYSCNLMMAYAQTYPQHLAAMVLDSPLPHQANYSEDMYHNVDSTLHRLVHHYTGSSQLYEDWKAYFMTVKDTTFTVTVEGHPYTCTSDALVDVLLTQMSDHNTLAEVPATLQRFMEGDYSATATAVQYHLEPSGQALGMRYSVWMAEELPEENKENTLREAAQHPWLEGYAINDVSYRTASYWPVQSVYENTVWPTASFAQPTYILSGKLDPWTPNWYGQQLLPLLPGAQHKVYPETTHLPGFTEQGVQDVTRFLEGIK